MTPYGSYRNAVKQKRTHFEPIHAIQSKGSDHSLNLRARFKITISILTKPMVY